jgi:hypothetical protein
VLLTPAEVVNLKVYKNLSVSLKVAESSLSKIIETAEPLLTLLSQLFEV